MICENFVNPYDGLEDDLPVGLNAIREAVITAGSFIDVNDVVCSYIGIDRLSEAGLTYKEALSILPNAYNAFLNLEYGNYNPLQYDFIDALYCTIKDNSTEAIGSILLDFETQVVKKTPINEQYPLLMATVFAKASNLYWQANISDESLWAPILSTKEYINYSYIKSIVLVTMQSVLYSLCERKSMSVIKGLNDNENIVFITALIAALGMNAGYVKYKWVPFIKL